MKAAAVAQGARADASDAVQETLKAAYEKADTFRGETSQSLYAWLHRILTNVVRGVRRRRGTAKRDVSREVSLATPGGSEVRLCDPHTTPAGATLKRETRAALDAAVAELPEKLRVVVELCDMRGLNYQEAAKELGLHAGTVSRRHDQALELLRRSGKGGRRAARG